MRACLTALVLVAAGSCRCGTGALGELHALLTASTDRVELPPTFVGAPRRAQVRLTSAGTAPVLISKSAIEGDAGFVLVVPPPAALAPGQSVDVTIDFAPATPGDAAATLVVDSNAENQPALRIALASSAQAAPDCDDHNPCTDEHFDPVAGVCVSADHDGACDDGSACTENDRCFHGACVGDAVTCADAQDCTRDTCDPATGCLFVPDDTLCADADPCSLDRCDASLGCTHAPAPDGTPCGSFQECSSVELCIAHACVSVDIPEGTPCNDGDVCTVNDVCTAGACTGTSTAVPPAVVAETFRVVAPLTSAFIGDTLYMSDGTVKVVPLGAGPFLPTASLDVIPGHGQLLASGTNLVGVVPTVDGSGSRVVVVDPGTTPATVLADVDAGGTLPGTRPGVVSPDGDTLYACRDDRRLLIEPLTAPFTTSTATTPLCNPQLAFAAAMNGALGLFRGTDARLHVTTLAPAGPVEVSSTPVPSADAIWLGTDRAVLTGGPDVVAVDLTAPDAPVLATVDDPCPGARPIAMIERDLYCTDGTRLQRVDFTDVTAPAADDAWGTVDLGGAGLDHDATRLVVGQGFGVPVSIVPLASAEVGDAVPIEAFGGMADTTVARDAAGATQVLGVSNAALIPFPTVPAGGDVVATLGLADVPGRPAFGDGILSLLSQPPAALSVAIPDDETRANQQGGVNAGFVGAGVEVGGPLFGGQELPTTRVAPDGHTLEIDAAAPVAFPAGVRPTYFSPVADDCVGVGLVEIGAGDLAHAPQVDTALVTFSICRPTLNLPALQPLGELPLALDMNDADVHAAKLVVHHQTTATLFVGDHLVLVDFSDPVAPRVVSETTLTPDVVGDTAGSLAFRDAGFDPSGIWLVTLVGGTGANGAGLVLEYDATTPAATLLSSWNVPSGAGGKLLRLRVLAVLYPRAFLSAWDTTGPVETGHGLGIWDLTTSPPSLEETVPLASEPVDLVPFNDTLAVFRTDGVSLVSPPCGP